MGLARDPFDESDTREHVWHVPPQRAYVYISIAIVPCLISDGSCGIYGKQASVRTARKQLDMFVIELGETNQVRKGKNGFWVMRISAFSPFPPIRI